LDRNDLGSSSPLTYPTHDHGHVQRCGQGKPTATTGCPSCPYLSLKTRRKRKKGVEMHYWEVLGKRVGQYGQVDRAQPSPCRLSDSHHLGMTRPQRIAFTAFLSALFVPSMFLLPVWCVRSEGMRSLLWDLSYSTSPFVTTLVTWAIPLIVFAVPCSVFAWVIARIWR
jgi:hypothetical protein